MKKTTLAVATALTIGIAAPAFAEGNGPLTREDSPSSFPPGFYDGTVQQMQAQIRQNWFASQAAQQPVANTQPHHVNPTGTQPNG